MSTIAPSPTSPGAGTPTPGSEGPRTSPVSGTPPEPHTLPPGGAPSLPVGLTWGQCWRVAGIVYDEFTFQSIYALKQGNTSVLLEGKRGEDAVKKARTRVAQSKGMVAFLLFMVIVGGAFALSSTIFRILGQGLPLGDYTISVISGELLLIFSLLWMTGLQVAPTLLGSRVFPLLATLPLTRRDMQRIGLLVFARIFDAPALTALIFFPLAVGWVTGSAAGALVLAVGTLVTVVLACTVSLVTARFFLVRVSGARGGRRGSILVRWVYLLIWSLPSIAITAFVSFSTEILSGLSYWESQNPSAFRLLLLAYPFPFSYLASVVVYPSLSVYGSLGDPVFWTVTAGYLLLAAVCARWLRTAPLEMALLSPRSSRQFEEVTTELRTSSPAGAILHKDMRIASRTPGYAFLILLPLLDAFILGLSTNVSQPSPAAADSFAFAAVIVAALLATFFGPAFFATEVMGYSFTRTLPITRRTLLFGKAALILMIYVSASVLVMALVAARISAPLPFALFAAAELPGVLAAAFLELGVLFHKAEEKGIPITNLYSGAWWAMLVTAPGMLVAGLPLLVYYFGERIYDIAVALPSMALTATVLLLVTASWAIWGGPRSAAA